jgi:molybdate transport repressor ModE-like protein
MKLTPKITIKLIADGGEKGFGPGIAELLEKVNSTGSLRAACALMNMSYSKAWSILKSCEKSLGFDLLTRTTGGESGGGSVITENGRNMLACYRRLERIVAEESRRMLQEQFGGLFPDTV